MTEVHDLRGLLDDLYTSVLTGALDPKIGTTLAQIANCRIRLVETEMRAREQLELEVRLEELEEALGHKKVGSRWGA